MSLKQFLLSLAFVFLSVSAFAQVPSLPYESVDKGPCEYCIYGKWIVVKATAIRKSRRSSAPIAFNVKKRERVTAVTGVVGTTKYGTMKVLRSTETEDGVRLRAGETLYLLRYVGEGYFVAWYKGREITVLSLDDSLDVTSSPEIVWWIQIRNKTGKVGWTNQANHFDSMTLNQ